VERNNEKVAHFYQPLNMAVLQLIRQVVRAGKQHNTPVAVCGEMAGDPLYVQILLSLGVDQFSMQPSAIPLVKHIIMNSSPDQLEEIAENAFSFKTINELRGYLAGKLQKIL
jgi:phosphotransferase system enzyme I (PtsI)